MVLESSTAASSADLRTRSNATAPIFDIQEQRRHFYVVYRFLDELMLHVIQQFFMYQEMRLHHQLFRYI